MDTTALTAALKAEAHRQGFALAGACPAVTPPGWPRLMQWLAAGHDAEMGFFRERLDAYRDPNAVLDGVRSLLLLGLPYRTREPAPAPAGCGTVARYAWSERDYHDVIHQKLRQLVRFARQLEPTVRARGVVDTAPLLERDYAALAGLGWIGKNTMLINRQYGSWFFLAALLLDRELQYDRPLEKGYCGTCTACLEACPTGAFPEPGVLDARRCISYWTIEKRGPLGQTNRSQLGPWVFGCDVCQDVCPWNRKALPAADDTFVPSPDLNPAPLDDWFQWDEAQFRQRFRRTALWRSRRGGLLRNAALVLAGAPEEVAISSLSRGLHDEDPLVRGACAWALGRIGTERTQAMLHERLGEEPDAEVRGEIRAALQACGPGSGQSQAR